MQIDNTTFVQTADEAEFDLISRAQEAANSGNWIVGECASRWLSTYAKGRTDEAFGELVGLSRQQILYRRQVWERFGKIHSRFPDITWTHFKAALQWDDAEDCLNWAQECEATVAEMTVWRRAQRGEDLLSEKSPSRDTSFENAGETTDAGGSEEKRNSGYTKNIEETKKPNTTSPVDGTTRTAKSSGDKGNQESPSKPVAAEIVDDDEDAVDAASTADRIITAFVIQCEVRDFIALKLKQTGGITDAYKKKVAKDLRKEADIYDPPDDDKIPTRTQLVTAIPDTWSDSLKQAATDWAAYKQARKKDDRIQSIRAWQIALKQMTDQEESTVVQKINNAIANSYKGWNHDSGSSGNGKSKSGASRGLTAEDVFR